MSPLMDIPEGLVETLQDRDPTAVNAIRSRSIHRKPSRSKAPKPKLQQLDATSFGAAVVALPSCHTSRIANFFSQRDDIKVDNVKDIDDDSVYSEASAPCEGRRIPSGPLSPLSMLFEGIMADCSTDVGLHGVCCDDSPYPYSPVSDSFVRSPDIPVFMPAEEDRGYLALQSEEYTSSPASSFLQTPHDSPLVEIETMLDQVLTHQITENAASDAASRASLQPLLAPEGSLLSIPGLSSPSSNGTSPTGSTGFNRPPRRNAILDPLCPEQRTKDVDSCRLTMPGGGPLLEPNEFDDSFEPFWSPFALESNRHTAEDNRSRTTEAMKANDSSPLRPPRPEHCRKKLENLGLITTTVPGEKGSPSLRSIRKAPADYLKTNRKPPAQSPQTNRRSGSTCSLDNIQMKDLSHFKLDPAPSKPRPIDTQGGSTDDRSSRLSGSTFVSAKSDVSIDTTTASSPTDATNVSRYPDKLVSEPVPARTNISTWSKGSHLQIYQLGEPMGIAKQDQALSESIAQQCFAPQSNSSHSFTCLHSFIVFPCSPEQSFTFDQHNFKILCLCSSTESSSFQLFITTFYFGNSQTNV
uniref:Uncharacterized protein n=1 Tax=Melanopsichium pennsylvanicum 4 TaxID=1398559 RepID=A0A077RBQ0_9BASI|nr:uncharacterized protein BN887_01352 [Melanopsichium pennsylvanicum 4]